MGQASGTVFAWMDLEMTGLDPERHAILEVALIITGADLEPRESADWVVWQPPSEMERMEPFVRRMHTANGLLRDIEAVGESARKVEQEVMDVLVRHVEVGQGVLAGNSVHHDRAFLRRHMPMVDRYLHYQHLDLTSVRHLVTSCVPTYEDAPAAPQRPHRAMADIRAALDEARHYRRYLRAPTGG